MSIEHLHKDDVQTPNYASMLDLSGRGYVVLGAGPGIGGEVCHALAQCGGRVLCVDISLEHARRTGEATGCDYMAADVTKRRDLESVFGKAGDLFGSSFKGLVDVVGVSVPNWIVDFTDEQISRQLDLGLRHAILATQMVAPMLAEGGGSITFVSSIAGLRSTRKVSLYGAAKAALHQFTVSAADEFGPKGVRVNAVAPGRIKNSGTVPPDLSQWQRIESAIPMRRAGVPSEIASSILFLASELASYVTGQVLVVDGGISGVSALPSTLT